jgi:methylated-DNA-[protein]-cysteine S-methyltransferase
MNRTYWDRIETDLGPIFVLVDNGGRVKQLCFGGEHPVGQRNPGLCSDVFTQLTEYLGGKRTRFDLELKPVGTAFQQLVWQTLTAIPFGEACGYGELARRTGNPAAARAVGQATGANPIPIIIPCHRVISTDGSIGGYSGGLEIKRRLLAVESIEIAA